MEGCSRKGEICPKLLDLAANEREWLVGRDKGRSFGASEEEQLELRLGPPGEDWSVKENSQNNNRKRDESLLSLGCFSTMASRAHNNNNGTNNSSSSGAKRGFLDTVEAKAGEENWLIISNGNQNQKLSSSASLWCQREQKAKHSSFQFPSNPPSVFVMTKESSQPCSSKLVELQNQEKKVCSPDTANTAVLNSSQRSGYEKSRAAAPVVGWPPIRTYRRNIANSSSSKPAPDTQNIAPKKLINGNPESCMKGCFVKINMDGVPIGRKVDLKAHDSYEKLAAAVDELFRGLLAAQIDSSASGNQDKTGEASAITGLLDRSGEYTLVYEDNEGDRMLVGDVPWHMFVSTVKRLRVLKSSELSTLHIGSLKQEKSSLESA